MTVTKFDFSIDKPFLSCYNLTVTGGVLMSKKNEIVTNNSDSYTPSMSINDLYSELSSANNHALDTYKDIIESPNVSEDIKKDFVKIYKKREHTMRQATIMIVGGIIFISAVYVFKNRP